MIEIQRIVPKNLINQLKLQKFSIALIEAKHANRVIQILKDLQTLPADTFFLKRVRKNKQQTDKTVYVQVLLCLSQEKDQFINDIQEAFLQAFQTEIIKQIIQLQIPRSAPASKKDFQIWSKYWPCNYLQPQFVKKIQHSLQEKVILQQLSEVASHQLQNVNAVYLFSSSRFLIHFQGPENQFTCKNQNPLEHPIIKMAQKWPQSSVFKQNQNQYYYFTNLRCFLKTQKICGMCAMALVHSRIQRVYFQQNCVPSQQILQILYSLKLNHKIDMLLIKRKQKEQEYEQQAYE